MKQTTSLQLLSIVIPAYNEQDGIGSFHASLTRVLKKLKNDIRYEIVYVNDGSRDGTLSALHKIASQDKNVRVICLSRNFGKELATTAGIHSANGDAVIMMDADGQHPVDILPSFIEKWRNGAMVVMGVREKNQNEGLTKKLGSYAFYKLFKLFTGVAMTPGLSDYTLIDATVKNEFVHIRERNRITRGLIDWMGFRKDTITFTANARMAGNASYSFHKLTMLAVNSFVSMSPAPLYFFSYVGALITILSSLTGLFVFIEQSLMGDPWGLHITGAATLGILIVFLVGLLLISQGITALYISQIHAESQGRPLYIIDKSQSLGA